MLEGCVWKYFNEDMFREYNMNPRGLNTNDCLFRALSLFLSKSWEEIAKINTDFYLKNGLYLYSYEYNKDGIGVPALYRYLESLGMHNIIPDYKEAEGDTYIGIVRPPKFMAEHPEVKSGRYLFSSGCHAATMIDGTVYDTNILGAVTSYTHCFRLI